MNGDGKFEFEDVSPDEVGTGFSRAGKKDEEDGDHRFRDREAERKGEDVTQEAEIDEPKAGEMTVEGMILCGFALDEHEQDAATIKSFLTKSSSLETASTGVGELLQDGMYDAQYDKMVEAKEKGEKLPHEMQREETPHQNAAKMAAILNHQVMLARMMARASVANVARHAHLIPKGKVVT